MKQFIRCYGRPKFICMDGDPWYHQAMKWLRLKHEVIKRWIQKLLGTLVPNPKTAHRKV